MAEVLTTTVNGNVDLTADNTLYVLGEDDFILDDNDDAIDIIASGIELIVRGIVGSDAFDGEGIEIVSGESNNTITIASTGIVSGDDEGIFVLSGLTDIVNNGKIIGSNDDGVDFSDDATPVSDSTLTNYGEIVGGDRGVESDGDNNRIWNYGQITGLAGEGIDIDGTNNRVTNSGEIVSLSGSDAAVNFQTVAGEINRLFNSGLISGQNLDGNAVTGGGGQETVVNRGTIDGGIFLGGGNDVFDGLGGSVTGAVGLGAGDDIYTIDDPTIVLFESPGEGFDIVRANMTFTLGDNFERLDLLGGGDFAGNGNALANTIIGNAGNNTLSGFDGNDTLSGNAGNDSLLGGRGNDVLIGGEGADDLDGGSGRDRASYRNATSGVRADLEDPSTNTGEAVGDTYTSIEDLLGSAFADVLLGDAGANRLFGDAGDDRLVGRDGNDFLVGGLGADDLEGGAGRDRAIYSAAATGVRADLGAPGTNTGEAAGDTYSSIEDLFGSSHDDILLGDSEGNTIWGSAGNDDLLGRFGDDTLIGGTGNDRLFGEQGDDQLFGQGGDDTLVGNQGNDSLTGQAGSDTFVFNPGFDMDVVTDFQLTIDILRLDDALWGGGLTEQQVIDNFATLDGNDAVFDFGGGDTITLLDVGTLDLSADILIV